MPQSRWTVGQPVVIVWEGKPESGVVKAIGRKLMRIRVGFREATFDWTEDPPRERRDIGAIGEIYSEEEYALRERATAAMRRVKDLFAREYRYGYRWRRDLVEALEELAQYCPEVKRA